MLIVLLINNHFACSIRDILTNLKVKGVGVNYMFWNLENKPIHLTINSGNHN